MKAYHFGRFRGTTEVRWCDGYQQVYNLYCTNITNEGCLYNINLREVLRSTHWVDCGIELFAAEKYEFNLVDYLELYNKQPGIRYIAESRLFSVINDGLSDSLKSTAINDELLSIIKSHNHSTQCFAKLIS